MKEHSAVQSHLSFIVDSFGIVKKENEFWTESLKKEYDIREKQKGTPYAQWLKYLKEKHLYCEYVKDIKAVMNICCSKSGIYDQFITQVVFTPCTMHQVEEVVMHLDSHVPFRHYNGGYWKSKFNDFEAEGNLEARKRLLASKLYHMDAPAVTHHTYIASVRPRTHWLDRLIDKILFIKR